jgi:hypothetical protein
MHLMTVAVYLIFREVDSSSWGLYREDRRLRLRLSSGKAPTNQKILVEPRLDMRVTMMPFGSYSM